MDSHMLSPECPQCGTPLAPGAAQGLCPRCLMAAAALPTEPAAADTLPELEQVAAAFPQLEVLGIIGRGGMGSVFKVRQPKLNRLAALKLLPHSLAEDPAFAGRFEREAQLLARLNHPNIVAVYDYGLTGGFFYLLMEFVDGVNLRQAMRATRFTPAQALGIVPKICEALQFAHEEGILHRDIKPENLLLDAKGRVKLADFGIAKLAAESEAAGGAVHHPDPLLTQAGSALGTPDYMAPEQRERPAEVDHRADIYSLGVVFYEILTGELPRPGAFVPPSGKSSVDPRVDAIVRQALESERERRQASAVEMKTQVENVGPREQVPARRAAGETSGVKLGRQKVKFTAPRERPRLEPESEAAPRNGLTGLASGLAVLLSLLGTWKDHGIEKPQGSGVPVEFTEIGAWPWLREAHWKIWHLPNDAPVRAGGTYFMDLDGFASGLPIVAAGLCWFIWLLLKRRSRAPLDSFLAEAAGSPALGISIYGVAVCSFSLWLFFTLAAMLVACAGPQVDNPLGPLSLGALHFFAIALGIAWTIRAIALGRHHRPIPATQAREEGVQAPPPATSWSSCLFLLVLLVCLLPLAVLIFVVFLLGPLRSGEASWPPDLETVFGDHSKPSSIPIPPTTTPVPEPSVTDVTIEVFEKTSVVDGPEAREVRQIAVRAEKPGYLHFWIEGNEPLTVPLCSESDGKHYRRNLLYSAHVAEPPMLYYSVITDNTQPKAEGSVNLANRHLTFETIATSMRQIADPAGKCLRGLPLDLVHVGSDALLIAVTDDEKMPPSENLYLHLWHPTYYSTPTKLVGGIETIAPRIGYLIQSKSQQLGRISQRDGSFVADLTYNFVTSQGSYRGPMILEQTVDPLYYSYSSGFAPFRLALSKQREITPFLQQQQEEDRKRIEKASQ